MTSTRNRAPAARPAGLAQMAHNLGSGALEVLGVARDILRGVEVGYLGPTLELEKTFAIAANTVQQFSMTVPATMAIDWYGVGFALPLVTFTTSISIGAVEYYSKRDAALAPTLPANQPPRYFRGLLRRIEVIQGDQVVITIQNLGGAATSATLWVTGYRLGADSCA